MKKDTNIIFRISDDLKQSFKLKCDSEETKISKKLIELIEDYLKRF